MGMVERAWNRIKGARSIEWIALLIGVAMLVMLLAPTDTEQEASGASTELEKRMERVLSAIEGAGRVHVLVREDEQVEAVFQSEDGARGDGAGVLVVAEGAGNLRVRLELIRAVQALLNIDAARIEVLEMERT